MNFHSKNKIDILFCKTFPEYTLNTIKKKYIDCFGINLSSAKNDGYSFKIYYANRPSVEIYTQKSQNPVLEFLYNRDMLKVIQARTDNGNMDFSKFYAGIKHRSDNNMLELFSFLDENIPLFKKNKEEIVKLSQMKLKTKEEYNYFALHFMGFGYEKGENVLFKTYWTNLLNLKTENYDKEYYLKYLQDTNIPQYKILAPIISKSSENCGGKIYMEGTDYKKDGAVSHKIYVRTFIKNPYDGLYSALSSNYDVLKEKILEIKEWNNVYHPNIQLGGYAFESDKNNNINLKLYYAILYDM